MYGNRRIPCIIYYKLGKHIMVGYPSAAVDDLQAEVDALNKKKSDVTKELNEKNKSFEALQAEGVGVNVHYIPTYLFPYYRKLGYKEGICPNAEKLYEKIISIPLYYGLSNEQQDGVTCAVKKVLEYYKK